MNGLRRALLLVSAPLTILAVALLVLLLTEFGLRLVVTAGVKASGGMLVVESVQGRLFDRWQLEGVLVQTPDVDVDLNRVEGQWRPLSLLRGAVRCVSLRGFGAEVRIKESESDGSWTPPARLLLPMAIVVDDLELDDLHIVDADGPLLPLFQKITLAAGAHSGQLVIQRCDVAMAGAQAHLQGSMGLGDGWPLDLQGSWRIEESVLGSVWGPLAADTTIQGTVMQPQAIIDVRSPTPGTMTLTISEPYGDLRWQADAELSGGQLLEKIFGSPEIVLEKAVLQANGDLATYQGKAQLSGQLPQGVTVHLGGDLSGDDEGLKVSSLQGLAEKNGKRLGTVQGAGSLDWRQELRWQAEVSGNEMDPGLFFSQWNGLVDLHLSSEGHLRDDGQVESEIELAALEGELFGRPFSGSGLLQVKGETLVFDDLRLRSGESEVRGSATLAESLDLRLDADIVDMGDFLPDAAGSASVRVSARGDLSAPEFSLEFRTDGLVYQDIRLQELQGTGAGSLGPAGRVEVQVEGRGLRYQEQLVSGLRADVQGNVAEHRIDLSLEDGEEHLSLRLAGGLVEQRWQGAVQQARLALSRFGEWQLSSPALLRADFAGAELAETCLTQGETKACAQGGWQAEGTQWQVKADLDGFECEQLYRWHVLPRPMEGALDASVQGKGAGSRIEQGSMQVDVPKLVVEAQDEEGRDLRLSWHDNRISLELADGKLIGMAKARSQKETSIDASLVVTGFGDLAAPLEPLPIQGEIDMHIHDLAPLAVLTDYAVSPTGAMAGVFKVRGTLGAPLLSGELRQKSGDIAVPLLGITLEDLVLSARMRQGGDGMSLALDLKSGPGSARLEADVERESQGWQMDIRVSGEGFEVANTAGYELQIDPDVTLALHEKVVHVGGRMRIPRAKIVGDALNHAVGTSPDIIFVDGKEEKKISFPVFGTVKVELGDEVLVDAFDVQGRVLGSVDIALSPGVPPVGWGNLTLEDGVYLLGDRALGITRGRFFMAGGPLDNPGIDVLAQTRSRNKTVGVLVTGTVKDMELKLFSDPPMPENAILVELLAGRSYSDTGHRVSSTLGAVASGIGMKRSGGFVENVLGRLEDQFALNNIYVESESGLSSSNDDLDRTTVTIGKNIFENLYVSYGYDPVRSTGIFRVRYDLWGGFFVETEMGDNRTGADLLWSFEKP